MLGAVVLVRIEQSGKVRPDRELVQLLLQLLQSVLLVRGIVVSKHGIVLLLNRSTFLAKDLQVFNTIQTLVTDLQHNLHLFASVHVASKLEQVLGVRELLEAQLDEAADALLNVLAISFDLLVINLGGLSLLEHLLDAFFEGNLVVQDGTCHDCHNVQIELVVLVRIIQVSKLGPLGKSCKLLLKIGDTMKYNVSKYDTKNVFKMDLRGGQLIGDFTLSVYQIFDLLLGRVVFGLNRSSLFAPNFDLLHVLLTLFTKLEHGLAVLVVLVLNELGDLEQVLGVVGNRQQVIQLFAERFARKRCQNMDP